MSRRKRNDEAGLPAGRLLGRARQATAKAKPDAAHMEPLARNAAAAVRRGVHRTRAWAAPQVERTAQVLQDSVAPKVSDVLSSAARRLEPAEPKRRHWLKLAVSVMLAAAASAVAAVVVNRKKTEVAVLSDGPGADEEDTAGTASAGQAGQPRRSG